MKKKVMAVVLAVAATGLIAAFATTASATPSKTSRCSGCHSGSGATITATRGTGTTYNVSAPGADYVAVFDGTVKLSQISGASGSFTGVAGKTYTLYAVTGPTTSDGLGTLTVVVPAAPPVDITAPVTTSDAKATYVTSAVIKLAATDAVGVTATYFTIDGGVQTSGTTINVSGAGSHTVQFWSVDAAGNVEAKKSATFTITIPAPVDITAPVTTSDAKATYVTSAVIKLAATDAVGVTATYFTIDGGAQTSGTTINVSGAGSHTVQFWSVDAAGNVEAKKSATFTITIPDTTAPVTTSDAGATYLNSAVIHLSATDNVGVTGTFYKLDGGLQTAGTTINVATAGSHTIEFWSTDAAGNAEAHKTASFTITIPAPVDITAPVTTSDAKATYVTSAVIKLAATDAVGVTATYFTINGGVQTSGTTINVSGAGSHTVQFWSVDAAGNVEAKKSATFTITIPAPVDITAPVTTSDAKATYVTSAVIKLAATDAVGVAHTYYILNGAAQVEGTTINLNAVGTYTLEFWSVDAAGNIEAHKTATFAITAPVPVPDTTAPVTTSDAKATYVTSAVIKLAATDNIGVAHTYFILDGAAQAEGTTVNVSSLGSHTLEFWSVDAAGNASTHGTATFTITAPAPAPTATVTIKSNVTSVREDHVVRLSGLLNPANFGAKLAVYVKKPGSTRWVLVSRPVVSVTGVWTLNYTPTSRGTYQFQVRYTTDAGTIVSRTIKVSSVRSSSDDD